MEHLHLKSLIKVTFSLVSKSHRLTEKEVRIDRVGSKHGVGMVSKKKSDTIQWTDGPMA